MSAKILWVSDEYDGPENGMAEYNSEKLWFNRLDKPNTDKYQYKLFRIDPKIADMLYTNHKSKCETTGFPLNHGDPMKVKKHHSTNKRDVAQDIPEGADSLEAKMRALSSVTGHSHNIIAKNVTGDLVAIISESDFSNYFVPRHVEMI